MVYNLVDYNFAIEVPIGQRRGLYQLVLIQGRNRVLKGFLLPDHFVMDFWKAAGSVEISGLFRNLIPTVNLSFLRIYEIVINLGG